LKKNNYRDILSRNYRSPKWKHWPLFYWWSTKRFNY